MIDLIEKVKTGLARVFGSSGHEKGPEDRTESPSTNKNVGTAEVNNALKKLLFPVLRQYGFTKIKGKRCYKYNQSSEKKYRDTIPINDESKEK